MIARLLSLRLWLLAAMIISAGVGLTAAAVLYGEVEHSHEFNADQAKALSEARTVARQVQAGADREDLSALQQLLTTDQLTVERAGRVIFRGPNPGSQLELRAQAPFAGGVVRLADYSSPAAGTTLDLILITAGVLGLVIAAALVAASLVTRSVRTPINRAIVAADRVASGDFSARMGAEGPQELSKLGEAFDDMTVRLERADADQRQFLADVAHEIATPINSVSGFALALADSAATTPEQRAEASAVISAETERLGQLLADLRELTSLDLADGVRLGPIALEDFARELVRRFRPAATNAGVKIEVDVRPATITTDARLLETIASNLLSNAIRYTPAGGEVQIRVRKHRKELVLAVRDSGVGISREHQPRIFERLYRVDHTRNRATGGLGLGLAIASRAAHSLAGRIELDSTPGRGSEFRVIVPLDRESEHREDEDLQRTAQGRHGSTKTKADGSQSGSPAS
ncbi:MAG: two-component system, OmpR family, sensor kinase [Solirubrobacteraceae bacterium]|jgi:signal transduction histidine kinase|nr:two-component system, OmpR family, sensor kinase [Solirubrobacteraceae bacterium]